jgi:hypothetical protein
LCFCCFWYPLRPIKTNGKTKTKRKYNIGGHVSKTHLCGGTRQLTANSFHARHFTF